MNQILFMYMIAIPSLILGFLLKHKMHDIKRTFYRGYTRIVFFDTGDIVNVYGRKQTYTTDRFGVDREYIIDQSKVKRETLILHSKMAEPPKIEADIDKFKYWIDSNVFSSVYKNKILETMMLIQENNLIKIILIFTILCVFASIMSIYVSFMALQNINSMSMVIQDLSNNLIIK